MKRIPVLFLWLSLLLAFGFSLQNCKKSTPDPVKPGTTNPGSTTTTPGTTTTTTPGTSTTAATSTLPTFGTTLTSSAITSTSATVSAVLTANGGAAISQHGFVYSKTMQTPTLADSKTEKGTTTGPFPLTISSNLTNLEANTTYYVRAFATNEKGTGYGEVAQVKTRAAEVVLRSNTTNTNTFIVTATSIDIGGSVEFTEGVKLGDIGFCYSDSKPEPTIADPKVVDPKPFLASDNRSASFKAFLPDLKPNTPYQIRPFATVDNVVYYGAVVKATTQSLLSTAMLTRKADFPGKTVSGNPVSFIINDKFYVNARRANADDSQFFMYDPATDTWMPKADLPMTGTNYKGGVNGISFTHNGKGYFGFSSGFSAQKALWEYDAATDKWKEVATATANPFGSWSLQTENVYLNGKLYVIAYGGTLFEFDADSRKATGKALPPGYDEASGANHLIVRDKTLYFYNHAKQTLAEYNVQSNTWTSKNKPPYHRQMVTVGSQLYAFGNGLISLYNPATDTWKDVLNLGTSTTVSQAYQDAFDSHSVFSRTANAYLGMRGAGVSGRWYEFKP